MLPPSRTRKALLEEGLIFSLPEMRRRGYFVPGISPRCEEVEIYRNGWPAGEIEFSYETDATNPEPWLTIHCTIRGREIRDRFEMVGLPQPFGGSSWYMRCPETGTLCKTLFLMPGARHWRSRKALGGAVAYETQYLDARWRALKRRDKVAQRIYRQHSPEEQRRYAKVEWSPKPKWMRWPTWHRALEEFVSWDARMDMAR